MNYKIRYLPLAVADLEEIVQYLQGFYSGTAVRVLNEMESQIAQLENYPYLAEEYVADPFFRRLVVDDFLIFYHVSEVQEEVQIFRILRGTWDIRKYLTSRQE